MIEKAACVGAKTLLSRFQDDHAHFAFGLELVLDCLVEDLLCRIKDERLDLSFFGPDLQRRFGVKRKVREEAFTNLLEPLVHRHLPSAAKPETPQPFQ